jgi:hypothetical protein
VIAIIVAAYLLVSYLLIGFKPDQLFIVAVFCCCYYISPTTRKFILAFSIFIIYWIIFDSMKAFPNYRYNTVHIQSLYQAEKYFFGIGDSGQILTPNEYWLKHKNAFLDLLAGIFYLTWIPVPLIFAFYLYLKDKKQYFNFALTFFWVNIIGFIIYYSYPAAPPWYVQEYGFIFRPGTPGNTAGLARFDQMVHAGIFQSIYAKSSNVFAAMPSLHSAYPMIVFYFALRNRLGWVNLLFAIITLGVWFAAIYTSHHYLLDVLAGISVGLVGIFSFQWMARKSVGLNALLDRSVLKLI